MPPMSSTAWLVALVILTVLQPVHSRILSIAPTTVVRIGHGEVSRNTSAGQTYANQTLLTHSKHKCDDPDWRDSALKLVKEIGFAGLFRDLKNNFKFEPSGITIVNGKFYVVFYNIRAVALVDDRFQFRSPANLLINQIGEESQFEAITWRPNTGTFLVVHEGVKHGVRLTPVVEELRMAPDLANYTITRKCPLNYGLEAPDSQGFAATQYWQSKEGTRYLLVLCKGNHCSTGSHGEEAGHGRIIVAQFNEDRGCSWNPVKVVKIPKAARLTDYTGMGFLGTKVGIISRVDSKLWVGEFDFEEFEFIGSGFMYSFPRDDDCKKTYCTLVGMQWIDPFRIVVASAHADTDQAYRCVQKDQSVHIFMLPS